MSTPPAENPRRTVAIYERADMASSGLASLQAVAYDKLDRYTSTTRGYAFNTYDNQDNIDAPLAPSDVLMANLLSLRLGARDVIPLFIDDGGPAQDLREALDHALVALRDAESFESYADLSALEEAMESLAAANGAALPVKGWTAVTVSKVLHRRRPHMVPLIDSRVRKFYGAKRSEVPWKALWEDIRENADWLAALASTKTTPDGRPLSVLRLADILIWTP
ncbi:DUF6308 family protein [Citricoccus alkalitolerans]|uniref:DUF6308 family protein n=1 Tax=Citricoccus alkalitolerans TaxID=246603 RepID=UPI0031E03F04